MKKDKALTGFFRREIKKCLRKLNLGKPTAADYSFVAFFDAEGRVRISVEPNDDNVLRGYVYVAGQWWADVDYLYDPFLPPDYYVCDPVADWIAASRASAGRQLDIEAACETFRRRTPKCLLPA